MRLSPEELGRFGDVAGLVEDQKRAGSQVVQAGSGAQDGGPDLGGVAGLQGSGRRGNIVDVARVGAEVARSRAHPLLEARQIGGQALRQVPGEATRQLRDTGPDLGHAAVRHQELTGGQQDHFLDGAETSLIGWVEDAHRIDLVAEQLDSDRSGAADGKMSTRPPRRANSPRPANLEHRVVAESEQLVEQLVPMNAG